MNAILTKRFEEMGARVKIHTAPPRFNFTPDDIQGIPRLDVLTDKKGEYFDIRFPANREPAQVDVVDINTDDRHLLLMVKTNDGKGHFSKSKFLCGHDERHWFVAAIPEVNGISSIRKAKEALQPSVVRGLLAHSNLKSTEKLTRKNEVFRRQGEWFFIPAPYLVVDPNCIHRNEPLSRGRGSKPHMMEFCYRSGGTLVYVNNQFPTGIPESTYKKLSEEKRKGNWRTFMRDAGVYAKGKISHADHATILLPDWCQVLMNTENQASSMRHLAFLD